jgi:hypothetical protein
MRFLLILVGLGGFIGGIITMSTAGGASTADKFTIIGAAITIAGSVALAAGLATVDIVMAIQEKRG